MRKKTVESPLGIRTTEATARKLDALLKSLPKDCTFRRKSATAPADVTVDQRTDVSAVTTRAMDRDREIIIPEGIELEDYRQNPIVLFGHDQNRPCGKCLWIKATPDGLTAKTRYPDRPSKYAGEWLPDFVFSMVQADVLRGKSIGFLPLEMREPTADELKSYPDCVNVISRCLLLEYSVVSVPSNPAALVEAVGKGMGWDHWGLKVVGKVRQPTPTPRQPVPIDYRRLVPDVNTVAENAYRNMLKTWEV